MHVIPEARNVQSSYENITAECPSCGRENIFNRASDLKDSHPVVHRYERCSECSAQLLLKGDEIGPAYEMMIMDCYELLDRKHYMYCILNLAQACEVFFSHYLRVELLYRPLASSPQRDVDRFNTLSRLLFRKIRTYSFEPMRNLFFWLVLKPRHPASLDETQPEIEGLQRTVRGLGGTSCDARAECIRAASHFINPLVPKLLLRLNSWDIASLRNQVVHKSAHKPTLNEVNEHLKEGREILFRLGHALGIRRDGVSSYLTGRRQAG